MSFYAVKRGRKPGVYDSWPECHKQVTGFNNAVFRKFPTKEQAWEFIGLEKMHDSTGPLDHRESSDNSSISAGSEQNESKFSNRDTEPSQAESSFSTSSNTANTTPRSSYPDDTPLSTSAAFETIGMLRATARMLRLTAEQLLSGIDSLSSNIEQVASSLHSSANGSGFSPGPRKPEDVRDSLKRSYSDYTPLGDDRPQSKKQYKPMRKNPSGTTDCGFTGTSFTDGEGQVVYTDGASVDNGKATATAGIGVYWGHNDPDNVSMRLPGKQTNNRAEIHAAKIAVKQAKKRGIKNLILHTDSEFLINAMTKWIKNWKRNGWTLVSGGPVVNREDFEELDAVLQGMNVKWVHVRGHFGIEGNEAADRLANEGARKPL